MPVNPRVLVALQPLSFAYSTEKKVWKRLQEPLLSLYTHNVVSVFTFEKPKRKQLWSQSQAQTNYHFQPKMN